MGYRYADSSMLKGASFKNKNRGVSLPHYGMEWATPDSAASEFKDYKDISSSTFGQTAAGTQPMSVSNLGNAIGDDPPGFENWPKSGSYRALGNPISLLNLMMQNKFGKLMGINTKADLLGQQAWSLEDIELARTRQMPRIADEMNRRGGTNSGFRDVKYGELEADALRAKGRVNTKTTQGLRDLDLQNRGLDLQYDMAAAFEAQKDQKGLEGIRKGWADRIKAIV